MSGVALLAMLGSNTAHAGSTEIFLRTLPPSHGAATRDDVTAVGGSLVMVATVPDESHVTFGRATDLIGRPVDYLRPIRTGRGTVAAPNAIAFSPGLLPSRMPVAAYGLTSGFGMRQHPLLGLLREHSGVDLAAPFGSPIYATSDGVVSSADWRGGYGLFIALDHGGGVQTRYGHLSRLNVAAGQQVHKGDVIGLVGSTGLSTGPHLHYEVRLNGQAVNPMPYLHSRLPAARR